jgi:hypothetical protein
VIGWGVNAAQGVFKDFNVGGEGITGWFLLVWGKSSALQRDVSSGKNQHNQF